VPTGSAECGTLEEHDVGASVAVYLHGILGVPMRYGNSYGLNSGWLPNPRTCFWGGWGGSMVVVGLDARMTVSYEINQMLDQDGMGDGRALGVVVTASDSLSG
jgi:hypothetical protein